VTRKTLPISQYVGESVEELLFNRLRRDYHIVEILTKVPPVKVYPTQASSTDHWAGAAGSAASATWVIITRGETGTVQAIEQESSS
jgi:hypothetical protein